MTKRTLVMVGAALLLAAACGSGGSAASDDESSAAASPTPSGVTMTGHYLLVDFSGGCDQSFVNVGGVRLTFEDGSGNVIGTATTESETSEEATAKGLKSCGHKADYSVTVPKVDFYSMVIEDDDVAQPSPMSYSELEANGFVWDIELFTGDPLDQVGLG